MNENPIQIDIIDFTNNDPCPYGTQGGRALSAKLIEHINNLFNVQIIGISFSGMTGMDISYSRESLISVIKHFRGEKGFFIKDLENQDLIENIHYAAIAKKQPVIVWNGDSYIILGEPLSTPNKNLLDTVLKERKTTTAKIANKLNISVQNASTKLKKLVDEGYILRVEETAETGGIEFIYKAII